MGQRLARRSRAAILKRSLSVQDDLAHAHGLGGDLDALVVGRELEGLLEGQLARGGQRSYTSAVALRVFVCFFSRQMFTSMSSPRGFSPTTWPS